MKSTFEEISRSTLGLKIMNSDHYATDLLHRYLIVF